MSETTLTPTQAQALTREIGHDTGQPLGVAFGGGEVRYGVAERDHVEALQFPNSVGIYDRMATDSAVTAVMRAVTLPIRKAQRAIDGTGCRPEVVNLIASDLGLPILGQDSTGADATSAPALPVRSKDRFIFAEHLRIALLALKYGFLPFEQVVRIEDTPAGKRVRLRKLAPRFPGTLTGIETAADGGLVGIRQPPLKAAGGGWITSQPAGYAGPSVPSTEDDLIPVSRLVMYSHEREGAAWQGRSLLRHAYRPWFLKDEAWRKRATMMDRTSMGIAEYQGAPGESEKQLAAGALLAQQARSGQTAGVGVPNGASLRFRGVEGTLPDHSEYIADLNAEIMDGALAQFQKLGDSATGSRALGTAFIDFFTLGLQAIDEWFTATFNEHVIEDLVDWNWGETEPAPRLVTTTEIGSDVASIAVSLRELVSSGALVADDSLDAWIREAFRLPVKSPQAPATGVSYQYDLDFGILTVNERRQQIGLSPIAGGDALPEPSTARFDTSSVAASRLPFAAPDHCGHVHAAVGDPQPLRDLTQVEAAAGYDPQVVDDAWRARLAPLLVAWQGVRADQIDAVLDRLEGLLEDGDLSALADLAAPTGLGVSVLQEALVSMAAAAAETAAAEAAAQGLNVAPASVTDLADGIAARAVATDALLASGLANAAVREALVQVGATASTEVVVAAVREHLESLTDSYLTEQLGGALTAAQNTARVATFTPIEDEAYFYASELLDGATCPECAAVDGKVYETLAEAEADYPTGGHKDCRGGARCRGTLVMVAGEAPPSVDDEDGDEPADDADPGPQLPPVPDVPPTPPELEQQEPPRTVGPLTGDQVQPAFAKAHPTLNSEQAQRVRYYTGDGFSELNRRLRADDLSEADTAAVEALDAILARSPAPADAILYRGLATAPTVVDGVITEVGFSSTTASAAVGRLYAGVDQGRTILRVNLKAGQPALGLDASLSDNPHEQEVLLPRGVRYRVVGESEVQGAYNLPTRLLDVEIIE